MAQLPGAFDANTVPPSDRNFDPLPDGWYAAHATDSDVLPTKHGGMYAKFTFEILEGPLKGRLVWSNVNIVNANAQAQAIGQRELADIGLAAGVAQFQDTKAVEFKPLQIKVGRDKTDKDKNVVKGYRAYDGTSTAPKPASQPAAAGAFGAPTQASAPAAAGGAAPWPKRA